MLLSPSVCSYIQVEPRFQATLKVPFSGNTWKRRQCHNRPQKYSASLVFGIWRYALTNGDASAVKSFGHVIRKRSCLGDQLRHLAMCSERIFLITCRALELPTSRTGFGINFSDDFGGVCANTLRSSGHLRITCLSVRIGTNSTSQ